MTSTEIANFALGILGSKRISDIDDDTVKSARIMKLHFAQARKEMLRRHRWNWAMCRKTLTAHADAPEYGYAYQYPLPTDFLRLSEVNEISVWDANSLDWFDIEQGKDEDDTAIGRVLVTDNATCRIRYVADITDTNQYDPLFVNCLALLLASKAARSITGSDDKELELKKQLEEFDLPNAQQIDGAETNSGENPPIYDLIAKSAIVRARGVHGLDYLPDGPVSPASYPSP